MATDEYTKIDEATAWQQYADMLDEVYPVIKFGDMEYLPSTVLEKVDPIAYRCGFSDWLDSQELELE